MTSYQKLKAENKRLEEKVKELRECIEKIVFKESVISVEQFCAEVRKAAKNLKS